jgi:hypothetical protein
MRTPLPSLVFGLLYQLAIQSIAFGQTVDKAAIPEPIITDEYAIFSVTTELQRELLESDTIEVCVFVNGAAFRDVEKINRFLPVFETLQKQLQELPKDTNAGVSFRCIDDRAAGEEFKSIEKRLGHLSTVCEEVGYYAGFLNVKSSQAYHNDEFDWQKWIDKAQAAVNPTAPREEPVTGNERVQVFFVRTFLSRLLSGADCKVTILPVVRTAGSFPSEFMSDLEKFLLPEKGNKPRKAMLLRIGFSPNLRKDIEAWIEDSDGRREFARKLGFEGCNVSPGPTSEADRFTQGPASRLAMKVKVVDPDGTPITDPKIVFRTNPTMELQTTVGSDGITVKMPDRPTWFNFTIKQPGYVPYYGEWDSRTDGTMLPSEFTARLEPAWRAGGIVVNEAGEPIPGAEIHPSIRMTVRPGDPLEIHTGDEFKADEGGRWTFDHFPLSDNELSVEISHPEYSPDWHRLARREYELKRDEDPTARINLKRAITIRGRVTDDHGQPMANALVRSQFSNIARQATSDSEGNYKLTGCAPGVARIVVSAPGKAMQLHQVDITADMKPLDITMQPGGRVRVRVLDKDNKPIPKARIFFQEWHGRIHYFEFDHVNQYADENGIWEWNEAPLEEFSADICPPGGMQLSNQPLKVREEEYVFHTDPVLTVSGKVTDAATGKPVESFHVVPGTVQENGRPYWSDYNRLGQTGGSYVMRFDRSAAGHFVRIKADGYRATESRKISSNEGAVTLSFELEPMEPVSP